MRDMPPRSPARRRGGSLSRELCRDTREPNELSAKTVAQKLLIKPGATVWSSHSDRLRLIEPLPEGVRTVGGLDEATTALIFADDEASVRAILAAHQDHLASPAHLWVAYPKANRTDINRDTLWPILAENGLRPITQVAVDDVWSALRFRPGKEGEAQFTGGNKS